MRSNITSVLLALLGYSGVSQATTLLLSDNFNDNPNNATWSFNDSLASTQAGSLATVTYSVQGFNYVAQHSNGGYLLVATATDGNGNGSVSLNNNFASQANAANQPLQITFNINSVAGYGDTTRWVQFNVGASQHLDVGNPGVGAGVLFRVSGDTQLLSAGAGIGTGGTWSADDLVTITFSGTGGVGSAFNGNGSQAAISIGSTNYGTFTLGQQTDAYLTFSAFNYGGDQFGLGRFDNLSVSLIPEPSALLLGGFGLLALLRRRR
ncbi:MAG: PEP-CTERM sorting domain-containing protein [Akkermansiaceae bacterium]|jgi:hypothetical protein|nr:PEP-CTERM sorting domain-containing protein [Akkermansiaceae bacterium]